MTNIRKMCRIWLLVFLLVSSLVACATFHSTSEAVQVPESSEASFQQASGHGTRIGSFLESFNPPGSIGGLYFDNQTFIKNLATELKLNLNDFEILGKEDDGGLEIFISGSMTTYTNPAGYIGAFLLYIIPTKMDYSRVNLLAEVSYRSIKLFQVQLTENLNTWGWIVPVFPLFPVDYNKSIATELSRKILKAFGTQEIINKVASIDSSATDSGPESSTQPGTSGSLSRSNVTNLVSTGTGFLVGNDGYLLTNFHVVKDGTMFQFKISGEDFNATIVSTDAASDIALLRIDVDNPISGLMLDLNPATLGESVYTIGYPNPGIQGLEPKYTSGEISSLKGIADDVRYMQVSVPLQPGNSGGPLLSKDGAVLGIVSDRLSDDKVYNATGALPQNVNYAVKISRAIPLLLDAGVLIYSESNTAKIVRTIEDVSNLTGLISVYQ